MKRKNKKKATENKLIKRKEKFGTRFINTIKKKWLISGTNTILLIAILIAITIFINSMVKSFKWTPIDLTSNKQYTLTETSKDRIKNITNNVDIYLVGYTDTDSIMVLANQYNKANKNINIEIIDLNTRTDIATEFSLKAGDRAIIVKSGEKSKVLTDNDYLHMIKNTIK